MIITIRQMNSALNLVNSVKLGSVVKQRDAIRESLITLIDVCLKKKLQEVDVSEENRETAEYITVLADIQEQALKEGVHQTRLR